MLSNWFMHPYITGSQWSHDRILEARIWADLPSDFHFDLIVYAMSQPVNNALSNTTTPSSALEVPGQFSSPPTTSTPPTITTTPHMMVLCLDDEALQRIIAGVADQLKSEPNKQRPNRQRSYHRHHQRRFKTSHHSIEQQPSAKTNTATVPVKPNVSQQIPAGLTRKCTTWSRSCRIDNKNCEKHINWNGKNLTGKFKQVLQTSTNQQDWSSVLLALR